MLQHILLVLLSSSLLLQSTSLNTASTQTPYEDAEAYAVYTAVLPSEWTWKAAKAKRLVIRSDTQTYQMCLEPDKEWKEVVGPAIADYLKQNESPRLLQPMFPIEKPYELLGDAEIKADLSGGWEGFYAKHPDSGGYLFLSAVGFNADKTVAVVYVAHSCGNLCGGGQFHVLQKKEGKWLPLAWKGMACAWAS